MIGGGGNNPYFVQNQQQQQQLFHHALDGFMEPPASDPADAHCHALLYNLSVLRDKVQQLQPLVELAVEHDGPGGAAVSSAGAVIQEIITAASSMMYAFQQLCGLHTGAQQSSTAAANGPPGVTNNIAAAGGHAKNGGMPDTDPKEAVVLDHHVMQQQWQPQHHHRGSYGYGYGYGYDNNTARTSAAAVHVPSQPATAAEEEAGGGTIIELDAAELLAKYTHYCQVCGKGFKRDANLRMHMRAHGDEYKSSAALANPAKAAGGGDAATTSSSSSSRSFYSCPQEGCRWNRKHAKFQPLKSVICAKNHYKRSHCPKMYVCNRCNRKHFSVLSDLRTHEKHCGDHRWVCSCGTSFSRKDKLIGHLALFTGHHAAVPLDRQPSGGRRLSSTSTAVSASQL